MAQFIDVADSSDPRLAEFRDLRDMELRKSIEAEYGLFLAEGHKVVRRAVQAGHSVRSFLMAPRWIETLADVLESTDAPCYVLSEADIERITGFHVHRGAIASLTRSPLPSVSDLLADARRVAILEDLVDHGNIGSAFRNAAALGIDAVLVTPQCSDPLYRRAIKTSMGNVFNVPWTRVGMPDALAALSSHGFTTTALTLSEDSISLDDLVAMQHQKLAFVFGTEGAGVDPRTATQVDFRVKIPMAGDVDSLNVAAATAVTFYAAR